MPIIIKSEGSIQNCVVCEECKLHLCPYFRPSAIPGGNTGWARHPHPDDHPDTEEFQAVRAFHAACPNAGQEFTWAWREAR